MRLFLKFIILLFSLSLYSQENQTYSVYLIGDAGENAEPGKALLILKEELLSHPRSAVVFLGDNVYPEGLKANDKNSELHLESQLQLLKEYAGQVYFIAGNHDWKAQKPKGLQQLKNQQDFVESYLKNQSKVANRNSSTFLPANGLPGPETVLLNDKLRLIIIDTQWFLQLYKKNYIQSKEHTKQLFYFHLDSLLNFSKKNNEQVIIAAHHPMFTNGLHSRSAQPFRFLVNYTPLQVFGLMGLNRLFSQDLDQRPYKKMRSRMIQSFNEYDNIIYASGHDHNLQFFKQEGCKYVVSGCGSKLSRLKKKKKFDSVFQDDTKTGFVKLVFTQGGGHTTIIYRVGEKEKVLEGF